MSVENLPQMGSNGVVNVSRIEAVLWKVEWASSAGVTGHGNVRRLMDSNLKRYWNYLVAVTKAHPYASSYTVNVRPLNVHR